MFSGDERSIQIFDARLFLVECKVNAFVIIQIQIVVWGFPLYCVQKFIDWLGMCPKNQSIICIEDFCISYAFNGFQLLCYVEFGFEILKEGPHKKYK